MDKNIAALLREDAKTIGVVFDLKVADFEEIQVSKPLRKTPVYMAGGVKVYTYVTHLDVAVNDFVVVEAAGETKLVLVVRVDEEVNIEPNADKQFGWVIAKVDMESHAANVERNKAIESTVSDAYRNNLRRSFAQQILACVDPSKAGTIQALISGGKA